jgi:hypothetical protein
MRHCKTIVTCVARKCQDLLGQCGVDSWGSRLHVSLRMRGLLLDSG